MQRKLVMADTDERYVRRLSQVLRRREQLAVGIQVITEKDILREYLRSHQVDWIFLTQEFLDDEVRELAKGHVTVLAEEDTGDTSVIMKYQPVDRLLEKILAVLPGQSMLSEQEIFAVYSFDGGSRSALFGLFLALSLGNCGSVFYLNLDSLCPVRKLMPEKSGSSISDWMFRYHQGLPLEVESMISWKGIRLLTPFTSPEDYEDLKKLDITEFLRAITQGQHFDWIIYQLGESPVQAAEFLGICRKMYIPLDGTAWQDVRREALIAYLRIVYGEDCGEKIIQPVLPLSEMEEMTEEELDRLYLTVWRDYIWEQQRQDRIL